MHLTMNNTTQNITLKKNPGSLGWLRWTALMAVLMAWMMPAMAQSGTDYSGVYYIANFTGYSSTESANNYYLVPADDPQKSHKADAFFNDQYCNDKDGTGDYTGDHYGDPEQPFITTYKTNKDQADLPHPNNMTARQDNSIWILKYVSTEAGKDYYHIIHAATGKYLVYQYPYKKAIQRKSMHLLTTDSPGENAKFVIIDKGSQTYCFSPKSPEGNTFKYFNPAGNNQDRYYGTGNDYFHSGMVGLWSSDSETNSQWKLEPTLCKAPKIHFDAAAGNYYITWHDSLVAQMPADYSIRYTTTGNDPTIDSTVYNGATIVVETDGTIVKAIVTGHGRVLSAMDTQEVNTASEPPTDPTFEMTCESKLQITSTPSTARIYFTYTTDGSTPANPDNTSGDEYTEPLSLTDNALVKAIAYNGSLSSDVVDYGPVLNNTPSPSISLTETQAEITFGSGVTIHYTTDGTEPDPDDTGESTSPFTITGLDYDTDVEIRVIATSSGHPNSCPVTIAKRPKRPIMIASKDCLGTTPVFTLTFSDTEEGKTYWYALANEGEPEPAHNTFTEYTPGSVVSIDTIHTWNGSSVKVDLYAYAKTEDGYESHVVQELNYELKYTDAPSISHTGNTVTIAPPSSAPTATIHYTDNGGSVQTYSTPFTVSEGQNHIIVATAKYGSEGESCEAIEIISLPQTITTLTQLNQMTVSGAYVLGADIVEAGSYTTKGTDANPFIGTFDGAGHTISGLTQPLFGTTNNAVIHDVNLKLVTISSSADTVGAVTCVAKGYTRIYSCGILPDAPEFGADDHPSVEAAKCAGSIVGSLRDDSRVINCFSFADVTATNSAAGIVGFNQCESDASVSEGKYHKLRTMVMNCMYYGDVTSASAYPVYGGRKIKNGGGFTGVTDVEDGKYAINNYNFYSDNCSFNGSSLPTDYYCSWPAPYDYLTRHEFHRYLLNSNRELCGWWVGATFAPSTMTTANVQAVPKDASLMAKWVLDRFTAPFPILKPFGKYSSPINIDANADWRNNAMEWQGKKLGTLSVTVNPGGHAATGVTSTTLAGVVITDMDTLHGDYCYRKIQLPYYNTVFGRPNSNDWTEKYAGNYKDYVVTGWEITEVNGSTAGTGSFTADWQDGYNFADRTSTKKDLYSVSKRIFAQGGYYYVPNDVTSIKITAHWGKAVYLGNGGNYYDRVDFDYLLKKGSPVVVLRQNLAGTAFAPAGTRPDALPNGKTIQTGKIATVAANAGFATGNTVTVYDNAIVLVNNHQYCTGKDDVNPSYKFTIMSADFDLDEEPDYCLEWELGHGTDRQKICPIRFDFLPVEEMGLCLKKDGSLQYYSLGCYVPTGHFEVTETALIHFGQFEFGNNVNPLILNGGIYDQYCKGTAAADAYNSNTGTYNDKTEYVIIGGNIYMPYFTPGAHVRVSSNKSTRHCAVNAIGGQYKELYLTGNYNNNVTPNTDNPHCYIDGGWFDQVAAAGKEGVDGDVFFKINHARIKEFYGGSTMDKSNMVVTGSIDVTVDNSHVRKYCGGPKFGNMNTGEGKTVTTSATNTHFGVYYGAGNGGTSYAQCYSTDATYDYYDANGNYKEYPWNTISGDTGGNLNYYNPPTYVGTPDFAYKADYDMEIINTSTGTYKGCAVIRTYFYAAEFAATNTGMVTNTLNHCVIDGNFYGAGKLGGVVGKEVDEVTVGVTSTLNNTEVIGSVFGAGYSADIPQVHIYEKSKVKPVIDLNTGVITPQSGDTHNTYTWSTSGTTADPITPNPNANGVDQFNYFHTEKSLVDLGKVNGNVMLTLKGNTTVGGNVFGGGDMSKVNGNTTVKIQEGTHILGNVYGGGNEGPVGGNSEVKIQD